MKINQNYLKLTQIFPHRWNWIIKKAEQTWRTIEKFVSDETLIKIYQNPEEIIGVGFGQYTQYLMLDIDKNSPHHPNNDPTAIARIELRLYEIGLTENIKIQSSHSGGIHIYYPLKTKLKSYRVGKKITEYFEQCAIKVKNGELEIFPNKKNGKYTNNSAEWTLYQRHRLPLQPQSGSYLLDNQYQPIILEGDSALEEFINQWEKIEAQQEEVTFKTFLYGKIYKKSATRKKMEAELEQQIMEGFTKDAETNDILLNLGRRIRIIYRIGGIELRDKMIETVTSMKGYIEYCGHQEEILQRCQDVARWAEKKFPLQGVKNKQDLPKPKTNNKIKAQEALSRIVEGLQLALMKTYYSIKEFVEYVCSLAKCSAKTLYKYQKLWRNKLVIEGNKESQIRLNENHTKTETSQVVCNSIENKTLSQIKENNTENKKAGLKALCQLDYSELKEKTTKEEENVENSKQDKGLSVEKDSQYILRLLFLSFLISENNEVKRNKQNSDESFGTSNTPCENSIVSVNTSRTTHETSKTAGEKLVSLAQENTELNLTISQESNQEVTNLEKLELKTEVVKNDIENLVEFGEDNEKPEAVNKLTGKQKSDKVNSEVKLEAVKNDSEVEASLGLEDESAKLEREKFISELKEKEINPPQNLLSLLKIATVEQLNNLRGLLEQNKTITNPIGFLIKALKNNWQPKKSSSVKTAKANLSRKTASNQPSWYLEFEKFYELAMATGYCQDCPAHWLPTNHRHEPMVRLTQPDEYLRIPYTLMYWRTAKEEFESLYPHLSIENWSAQT